MPRKTAEVVAQFYASGLTQKAFCAQQSISPSLLQYHLRKSRQSSQASAGSFLALDSSSEHAPIECAVLILQGTFTLRQIATLVASCGRQ
jgi:hypothetical protein